MSRTWCSRFIYYALEHELVPKKGLVPLSIHSEGTNVFPRTTTSTSDFLTFPIETLLWSCRIFQRLSGWFVKRNTCQRQSDTLHQLLLSILSFERWNLFFWCLLILLRAVIGKCCPLHLFYLVFGRYSILLHKRQWIKLSRQNLIVTDLLGLKAVHWLKVEIFISSVT